MKEEPMGNEAVRNEAGGTKGMAGRLAVLVLAAGLLAGCVGSSAPGTAAGDTSGEQARTGTAQGSRTGQGNGPDREEGASRQVTILVAAAASLKNVLDQKLIPMFEEQNPGVRVEGPYET